MCDHLLDLIIVEIGDYNPIFGIIEFRNEFDPCQGTPYFNQFTHFTYNDVLMLVDALIFVNGLVTFLKPLFNDSWQWWVASENNCKDEKEFCWHQTLYSFI